MRRLISRAHTCSEFARSVSHHVAALAPCVLSFGEGSQGALGLRSYGPEYEPEPLPLGDDITDIGTGHFHSFALDEAGRLWSWGRNHEQQLGRQGEVRDGLASSARPGRVEGLEGIQVVQATGSGVVSFAVSSDGQLFSWGSSRRGQLGLGSSNVSAAYPTKIAGMERISHVAAGWGHALALDDEGSLYSWGYPDCGRLGHALADGTDEGHEHAVMQQCVWRPQKVQALSGLKLEKIACGMDFSLAVDGDGRVFAFGDNSLGQLGRPCGGQGGSDAHDWILRDMHGREVFVEEVAAGLAHCLAVSATGEVLSWGWNAAGQLGLGEATSRSQPPWPSAIPGLRAQAEAHIAAGRVHSMLAIGAPAAEAAAEGTGPDTRGRLSAAHVFAWGSGRDGRLGHGSQHSASTARSIEVLHDVAILKLKCGFDHTLVLQGD